MPVRRVEHSNVRHQAWIRVRQVVAPALCIFLSIALEGCHLDLVKHHVGNWRAQPSYLDDFAVTPPGTSHLAARLNSCADERLPAPLRCGGHGQCKDWFRPAPGAGDEMTPLRFCECDRDWAGPECGTQRKSQFTALLLALFLGPLGADQFYLGWPTLGALKLVSFGGLGFWWIFDVVLIGSTPVKTSDSFRVANDVDHWVFVLLVLSFAGVLGFAASIWSIHRDRVQKARELLSLKLEAEDGFWHYSTMAPGAAVAQPSLAVSRAY
mmetsp:Transcript_22097/g.63288  ORF Transcript_22097/g.63288 Transcript_22097/m.63288 type:complete len:267 (-) Transcript_22097:51-851(-)